MRITETERLYLREFIAEDATHLFQMNKDKDVIRFTGDKKFSSLNAAKSLIANYDEYKKHKMGRWAVCLKSNNEFLGWCGLKFHPEENYVEVGYRFYKKNWGRGYATESAKASIEYGFETLKLHAVFAHADVANDASHRVIEKCGLKFVKQDEYDGMPAKLYKIENPFIEIKKISSKDTYAVRHPVLRKDKPIEDCVFKDDDLETTVHLGLMFKSELVGVATFLKNSNIVFAEKNQYQLRGMAVLETFQGYKFGALLLEHGEQLLIHKKVERLWFNARKNAVPFYEKHGYKIIGDTFEIPNVGIHYVMTKMLNTNDKLPISKG